LADVSIHRGLQSLEADGHPLDWKRAGLGPRGMRSPLSRSFSSSCRFSVPVLTIRALSSKCATTGRARATANVRI
jgi:hypothetical protein